MIGDFGLSTALRKSINDWPPSGVAKTIIKAKLTNGLIPSGMAAIGQSRLRNGTVTHFSDQHSGTGAMDQLVQHASAAHLARRQDAGRSVLGAFPANRKPRLEPRERWLRGSPCARPWALVRGSPGAKLKLNVSFLNGRKHLPFVSLVRAA